VRIATWNVNSIRSRIDRVTGWLERNDVDVLAIQETKCREAHVGVLVAHMGLSQWNGVAIISRVGLDDVATRFADDQPMFGDPEVVEARSIGATCGGVRVWSFYVPNGREVGHPHYAYKLAWLESLRQEAAGWLAADPSAQIALTGDWNVAPQDDDVWDMSVFEGHTHVSQPERDAFHAVVDAGYADVVRPHTPGPGVYTYWDYQQLAFPKKRGLRIDFILASQALASRVDSAWIDREERKGKGASDHAPVVIEIA
jgi:exodeoxyribonuclease-3